MSHLEPDTPLWDLAHVVNRAWVLNEILEDEIHQPVGRGYGNTGGGSKPGSRAPWEGQAANLVMNLHSTARSIELEFITMVNPETRAIRGGSDRNTWFALYHLTDLGAAIPTGHVKRATHTLTGWTWRAEVFLGEREPIHQLPRIVGHVEPECPWCGFRTLRYRVSDGMVFCVNPLCRDPDDNKVTAQLTVKIDGDLTLTWQNGVEHVPAPGNTRGGGA